MRPPEVPSAPSYSVILSECPKVCTAWLNASACSSSLWNSAMFWRVSNSTWDIFLSLILHCHDYLCLHLREINPISGEHREFQVERVNFRWLITESFWAFSLAMNFTSKAAKTLEQTCLYVSQSTPIDLTKPVDRLLEVLKCLLASRSCFAREDFPIKHLLGWSSSLCSKFWI